jgi:hypothetical protein
MGLIFWPLTGNISLLPLYIRVDRYSDAALVRARAASSIEPGPHGNLVARC